eukprot:5098990-Prymnesium_polylepis.5
MHSLCTVSSSSRKLHSGPPLAPWPTPIHSLIAQQLNPNTSSSAAYALSLRPPTPNRLFAYSPAMRYSVARAAFSTWGGVWRIWYTTRTTVGSVP